MVPNTCNSECIGKIIKAPEHASGPYSMALTANVSASKSAVCGTAEMLALPRSGSTTGPALGALGVPPQFGSQGGQLASSLLLKTIWGESFGTSCV
mmetsp:Transcript_29450/g.67843  ORF Transcript_29450/g.67843 Transcript_29450/m.67843 type:complete len:96 (-) Transcript_29450:618-905(-)